MQENYPKLVSCCPLKPEYDNFKEINLSSARFSLGRGLNNSVTIAYLPISRNHCIFTTSDNNEWIIEDCSSFGIHINGHRLGKGGTKMLSHGDIIILDTLQEFVYKFIHPSSCDTFEIPKKRMKLQDVHDDMDMSDVQIKFEESQSYERKHLEDRIQNTKQMQTTSKILKEQLQLEMSRKIEKLESKFALEIANLEGEKNEVELQKLALLEERDAQLTRVKEESEGKIEELKNQIERHNETESELIKENNLLKEKLNKEREEFIAELNRENSSKQDMMEKLQAKIKEQEELQLKEKQRLEDLLRKETEQLQLAKETELKALEEQKQLRELEFVETLNNMKRNLEEQVKQKEQQCLQSELQLNDQMEKMKKLSDEDKVKMDELMKEREDIQKKLSEAQNCAEKSIEELRTQVQQREVELAALASERIQKQAEQSNEVINSLQQQLEKVKSELQTVEIEKNTLLECICTDTPGEGTSKQANLEEVGDLVENEFQCSICSELFVAATTLNCSHTFCKYCITMWKKKKKDCPICRAAITSECKSLVVDSFIDRIIQGRSEDVKQKRTELLKSREGAATSKRTTTAANPTTTTRRRRRSTITTTMTTTGAVAATTRPMITVDLTGFPSPMATTTNRTVRVHPHTRMVQPRVPVPAMRPPAVRPPAVRPPAVRQPAVRQQSEVVYQLIQQNGQVLAMIVDGGADLSQVSPMRTTAVTDAASRAGQEDTGRPAAPTDNQPRRQ